MKRWIKKIISKLVKWFEPKHITEYTEELPEILANRTIYLVGQHENPWLIVFKCPCGCDNVIHLNLLEDAEPRWEYKETQRKKVTIYPSVWRTKGCNSHFFVRNSKIDWVGRRRKLRFN